MSDISTPCCKRCREPEYACICEESLEERFAWYDGDEDLEDLLEEFGGDEDVLFSYLWALSKDD